MYLLEILEPEPLRREARRQRLSARVGHHAPDLPLYLGGIRQIAVLRELQQLLVGRRAPEEERESRRQIDVADAIDIARPHVGGALFHAEEEVRAGQHRLQSGANAALETSVRCAAIVERHETVDVVLPHWTPVRLCGHACDDLPSTRPSFIRRRRAAAENHPPRRSLGHARDLERAQDRHALQMVLGGHAEPDTDLPIGQGMIDRANQVVHDALVLAHESGGHALRPRGDLERIGADVQARGLGLRHPAVDGQQRHALPVDGDFDLLIAVRPREDLTLDRGIGHDVEHVFPVRGEVVHDREAAPRPERCVLDALPL